MYSEVLHRLKSNYTFVDFHKKQYNVGDLILRHDIDFSLESAYEMAKMKTDMEIKANYFFLVGSSAYNLFDTDKEYILQYIGNNHNVGLHFNITDGKNIREQFWQQMNIIKERFPKKEYFTSIHRPDKYFLNNNTLPFHHSYEKEYFSDIKYFSDSRCDKTIHGIFESKEFIVSYPLQVLIHPIWWMNGSDHLHENIKKIKEKKQDEFERYINSNIRL